MDKKLQTIDAELEKLMDAMRGHDLSDEEYKTKVDAYEKLTKIKLLLQGESTENITINTVKEKSTEELLKLVHGEEADSGEGTGEEGVS